MRSILEFLLHDWLSAESLLSRPRFADHSRETLAAVLDLSEKIAADHYAPHNREVDVQEPRFDGERVHLPPAVAVAVSAHAQAGLRSAGQAYEHGGMQLPYLVEAASRCFFMQASIGIDAYAMLSVANANLLRAHGTPRQQAVFADPTFAGRYTGTMCLSEPQAGSSLGDIRTRAVPDGAGFEADPLGPRYRLTGHKMWISGGEHDLAENIVHLVLAKVPDADGSLPPGVKGISLFVVPRVLVDDAGRPTGERNDVALAGLNHKLGYRGTVNTLLNFGERGGAIGWRVGAVGDGLRCMFHMMNEARIQVGLGAAMLGMAGYRASLEYARVRPQGRPGAVKEVAQPQRPIIEHVDVRRMLLAQKAYAEGGLALGLYCARLVDEKATADAAPAADAALLLELLTPIAKSWPSEWCLEANSLAIQIHGGYGYTRDFPVEQYWRDNRLNMIHEGTHGIQAQDLMVRKLRLQDGRGWQLLRGRMAGTMARAIELSELRPLADGLGAAFGAADRCLAALADAPDRALRNAVPGLRALGHLVLAWVWLDLACLAQASLRQPEAAGREDMLQGIVQTARFFHAHELPHVEAWLAPLAAADSSAEAMQDAWF